MGNGIESNFTRNSQELLERRSSSKVHGLHIENYRYNALDNITRRDFFSGGTTRTAGSVGHLTHGSAPPSRGAAPSHAHPDPG